MAATWPLPDGLCQMASAKWPLPGYIDENNYLCLSGRYKEIINRGGEKISPFEATKCAGSNLGCEGHWELCILSHTVQYLWIEYDRFM